MHATRLAVLCCAAVLILPPHAYAERTISYVGAHH